MNESTIKQIIHEIFVESSSGNTISDIIENKINKIIEKHGGDSRVSSDMDLQELASKFHHIKIPELPEDPEQFISTLQESVINHAVHTFSPRFIGHMTAALPVFMRPLAKLMVFFNQNPVKMETSRSFSPFERETIAMLHKKMYGATDAFYEKHIQRPESTLGIMTSGGTTANLTAMWCARNKSLGPSGGFKGIEREGMIEALKYFDKKDAVVIGSELMHYSFDKAADIMGIGTKNLIKIPVNENYQISLDILEETVRKCEKDKRHILALVGVAGTTDIGSIDDLQKMGEIAASAKTHFHVDAAWGGPIVFSHKYRDLLKGIEMADSITVDGHKQLYVPMGNGMILFRDPELAKNIEKSAPYVIRTGSTDLGKRSIEGSRPAMSLLLYSALHLIGERGFEFLTEEGIKKTQYLCKKLRANDSYEVIHDPVLNILLFRYLPEKIRMKQLGTNITESENDIINQFNESLQKQQRREGRTFISRTTLKKRYGEKIFPVVALRAVISNPLSDYSIIDEVIRDQIEIAKKMENMSR